MTMRPLHEVLAQVIDAGHRYPALYPQIINCLFDDDGLRAGIYRLETDAADRCVDGKQLAVLSTKLWPTEWLLQFARAVSQGVMPEVSLPRADEVAEEVCSDEGHGFLRSRGDPENDCTKPRDPAHSTRNEHGVTLNEHR